MLRSHQHVRTGWRLLLCRVTSKQHNLNTWGLAGKYTQSAVTIGAGSTVHADGPATRALEQPEGPVAAGQQHFWRQ